MGARVIGTRRSTMNRRRKGVLSVALPWLRRFGVFTAVLVFGVWLGAWLYLTGGMAAMSAYARAETLELTAGAGFKIQNVLVEGRVHADAKTVQELLGVEKNAPLFSFNPGAAKERVEKMEWVKRATVERRLPDTVFVRIEERKPLAFWQKDKTLKLLGEDGAVIKEKNLAQFRDLIIVMGDDAPARAPELLANLQAEPELITRAASAKWIDGRRWNLLLKNNIAVKLPEDDMGLALRRLADAQRDDKILEKEIIEIDMRAVDRITVRTKPGAVEEYRAQKAGAATEKAI